MIKTQECKNCANKDFCGKRARYSADVEAVSLGVKGDNTDIEIRCKYFRQEERIPRETK